MKKLFPAIILLTGLTWLACKKESTPVHIDMNAPAPASLVKVRITNIPGGAILNYDIPNDPNLLYVKAVYNANTELQRESKASLYGDTLIVSGFGDTLPHIVKLYAVGRNEKASAPLEVTVNPLSPPVRETFKTFNLQATFGGAALLFKNAAATPLTYYIMVDTTGKKTWKTLRIYTSSSTDGSVTYRGMDTITKNFAAYIKDRYGNKSDTQYATFKPIFERPIDKSTFKEVDLPTDNYEGHTWSGLSLRVMSFMWNNIWNSDNDVFHTKTSIALMPAWFTFDMGATNLLSRFKFYHRSGTSGAYVGGDPQIFEFYGSNKPNPDGSWDDSWTFIGRFNSVKPTAGTAVTAEDKTFACVNGEEFDIPPGTPAYRYIRVRILKTWGDFTYFYISELSFWGSKQ
ncbi:DUF5000 domain-containing lipoprotein [Chitinophaga sp. Cy-1792]|uniref:DUF5000 domain-containing lipoprotein n=1 Tax=Chitinophaga sp. Cy-1792 TaxID=2608339 RepID=UPI001423EB68|nr:DUF5000 domain-containing lipoprotein [Chitinophaga sp. Cy-1792]NIG54961.1 DUF4959 domain-containing protein [Chitinophaga sp. Cy-1792]